MKKALLGLILLIGLFTSCRTPKIVTETVYKDTVIYKERWDSLDVPVFVPAEGIKLNHKLPPGLPVDYKAEGEIKKDSKTIKYKIDNGTIDISYNKEAYMDTIKNLKVKVFDLERKISAQTKTTEIKEVPVVKYKLPSWAIWYIGVTATAVIVFGIAKGWFSGVFGFVKKAIQFIIKLF